MACAAVVAQILSWGGLAYAGRVGSRSGGIVDTVKAPLPVVLWHGEFLGTALLKDPPQPRLANSDTFPESPSFACQKCCEVIYSTRV